MSQSLHERRFLNSVGAYQDQNTSDTNPDIYIDNTDRVDMDVYDMSFTGRTLYMGMTSYGFPTWEQVRNNDRHKNNIIKKS